MADREGSPGGAARSPFLRILLWLFGGAAAGALVGAALFIFGSGVDGYMKALRGEGEPILFLGSGSPATDAIIVTTLFAFGGAVFGGSLGLAAGLLSAWRRS
ncbi:MAG TPA: hypothetical protein VD968_19585 [Pyrinomonadaceae bacterium]|nr:hypothetical protein [Pyrinomonadaceae bacterium]